ncbi:hypothetical protein N665_0531s0014 [Sinapis alba]|nr:hypothetical protein N665_0531s0014 [Sinapis alba]
MKTYVEEITYSDLIECICRKIKADGDGMLKISYFPMVLYSKKASYIWCDEDALGYLMQVNNEKCRSVLHVEINIDIENAYGGLSLSEEDDGTDDSYVGLSDRGDVDTDETEEDEIEEDELRKMKLRKMEQQQDIEMHENLEHGYEGT